MSRSLRIGLLITDISFFFYWSLNVAAALGVLHVPGAWLYSHYDDPRVVAWNWSFLPVDLAFSIVGFAALAADRRGDPRWRPLALISLILTSVAGAMAVSYWTFTREIDPAWFGINLLIAIWPIVWVYRIVCEILSDGDTRRAV